ncbi:MAG: hypothetical protein H8E86_04505, partial [Planctomycetes bacterium]|nr:hypothetical protein [Planctomycetota bacterium]
MIRKNGLPCSQELILCALALFTPALKQASASTGFVEYRFTGEVVISTQYEAYDPLVFTFGIVS